MLSLIFVIRHTFHACTWMGLHAKYCCTFYCYLSTVVLRLLCASTAQYSLIVILNDHSLAILEVCALTALEFLFFFATRL